MLISMFFSLPQLHELAEEPVLLGFGFLRAELIAGEIQQGSKSLLGMDSRFERGIENKKHHCMESHWGTLASKKSREIVFPNNLCRKTSSEWGIIYFCS